MTAYDRATPEQRRAVFEAAVVQEAAWRLDGHTPGWPETIAVNAAVRAATKPRWTVDGGAIRCSDGRVISLVGWVSPPAEYLPVSDGTLKVAENAACAALNEAENVRHHRRPARGRGAAAG